MSNGTMARFSLPTEIVYGVNTVLLLGSEVKKLGGKKAEDGVTTTGYGDRDSEDVVYDERTARHYAGIGTQQLGRHHIATTTGWEMLNNLAVG